MAGRVLILAHREELIHQAVDHASNVGITAGIEMGTFRARREPVVVSSIQTQIASGKCRACRGLGCDFCHNGRVRRMERFDPFDFGLVIVDEGHHATAKSYRTVLNHYRQNPNLKVLLVTATPRRADGVGLHNVCDSVAYEMDLREAIGEGWLCPIRQRFVTVHSLDLSKVGTKAGGDLADGDLERAFLGDNEKEEEARLHEIAKPCVDQANGQPLLVFASGCEHAEKLTGAFMAYGVRAELVLGRTDKEERRRIVNRYKSGETQVLIGVGVFTEGFDAPGTAVVGIARPTKSESLYLQMIGRATRPLAGIVDGLMDAESRRASIAASGKPHCVVLDFVGNSGRHKLISVADVLAGTDVNTFDMEAAIKLAKQADSDVDMEELLENAKQAREAKEKAAEERRIQATQHKAERAEYTAQDVDLFAGRNFDPFTDYRPTPVGASQKQVAYLMKLGVPADVATNYSKRQAGKVIDELSKKTGGDFILTFGKHKGRKLKDIPRGYVEWMIAGGIGGDRIKEQVEIMRRGTQPHAA